MRSKHLKYFRLSHDLHQASENSYFKPEERSFRGGESILNYWNHVYLTMISYILFLFRWAENFPRNHISSSKAVPYHEQIFLCFCPDFDEKRKLVSHRFLPVYRNQNKKSWFHFHSLLDWQFFGQKRTLWRHKNVIFGFLSIFWPFRGLLWKSWFFIFWMPSLAMTIFNR